jgi:hypothetical protein
MSSFGEYHHVDEEKNLGEAIRQSGQVAQSRANRPSLQRADTTDRDELEMVLKISMYDQ